MKKTTLFQALCLVCAGCLFLIAWLPATAQGENLLENPGFETPFNTIDGDPPRQVAQGWSPWHVPAPAGSPTHVNAQPEYEATAPDTARIREGTNAQQMRAFYVSFDGGVYQRVTGVTAGASLRFAVQAYVWSSTYDEVDLSELDGDVFVQVGIDPNGGTDPESASIVWSAAGVENYDSFNEYSVEADASGTAVTVFVRATIGDPVRNTRIYLDEGVLEAAGAETPVATDTDEPTATDTEVAPTETATATDTTEPEEEPSSTATEDTLGLTATAIVGMATETASAADTATAQVTPTATDTATIMPSATTDTGISLTATAIIDAATGTAQAAFMTATAIAENATDTPVPEPTENPFPNTVMHTVQRGETVAILAARYGTTIQAIAEANSLGSSFLIHVGQTLIIPVPDPIPATLTNTPTTVVVTATPVGGGEPTATITTTTYIVRPGDTLSGIAQRFNTTVGTLAQLNGIVNVNRIQAGQVLRLPGPPPTNNSPTPPPTPEPVTTYIVRPGDSLYRISLQFGVSIGELAAANNITNPNRIYVGQMLVIP